MSISDTTMRKGRRGKLGSVLDRRLLCWLQAAALLAVTLTSFGCAPPGRSRENQAPPGLVVGAHLADIRMFEFDGQSRITLVDGEVVAIAWPWVQVGSRADSGDARFWVNFSHVCSFRLEK